MLIFIKLFIKSKCIQSVCTYIYIFVQSENEITSKVGTITSYRVFVNYICKRGYPPPNTSGIQKKMGFHFAINR